MTLRPFPDFTDFPTHHCGTGSLRHIYEHHGGPISEDLLNPGRLRAMEGRWETVAAAPASGPPGAPGALLEEGTRPLVAIADCEEDSRGWLLVVVA